MSRSRLNRRSHPAWSRSGKRCPRCRRETRLKALDKKKSASQKDLALASRRTAGYLGSRSCGRIDARHDGSEGKSFADRWALGCEPVAAAERGESAERVAAVGRGTAGRSQQNSQCANSSASRIGNGDGAGADCDSDAAWQPPAAAAQFSAIPTTEQNKAVSLAGAAGLIKKEKVSLPNGLQALSVTSGGDRTIALDTKGALFLSEDGGKHWKPVRTQWTGRAVLVRSVNTAEKGNALGAVRRSEGVGDGEVRAGELAIFRRGLARTEIPGH